MLAAEVFSDFIRGDAGVPALTGELKDLLVGSLLAALGQGVGLQLCAARAAGISAGLPHRGSMNHGSWN